MKVFPYKILDLYRVEVEVFNDHRGFFFESFNQKKFEESIGRSVDFVQDNHTFSLKGVLRGLHYQISYPQAKLIRVLSGEIFDVAVDIRKKSLTFGKWIGLYLSAKNKHQFWIPEGFAHGFLVLSNTAEISYKVTEYYFPEYERSIRWNDPVIGINWPEEIVPILSHRDTRAESLCFETKKNIRGFSAKE